MARYPTEEACAIRGVLRLSVREGVPFRLGAMLLGPRSEFDQEAYSGAYFMAQTSGH